MSIVHLFQLDVHYHVHYQSKDVLEYSAPKGQDYLDFFKCIKN